MPGDMLSIGELAAMVGIKTSRIRYYEDIGLLPRAVRTRGDQRIYTQRDAKRLTFLTRCRDHGFSIDQVRQLLELSVDAESDCTEIGQIAAGHLASVRERLSELRALERSLSEFVRECDTACRGGSAKECRVFDAIVTVD